MLGVLRQGKESEAAAVIFLSGGDGRWGRREIVSRLGGFCTEGKLAAFVEGRGSERRGVLWGEEQFGVGCVCVEPKQSIGLWWASDLGEVVRPCGKIDEHDLLAIGESKWPVDGGESLDRSDLGCGGLLRRRGRKCRGVGLEG